jgi:hypothetical protein
MPQVSSLTNIRISLSLVFLTLVMSGCWSARCPRTTCRVRVEHRHGEAYYRPREAMSWMWTPRYKHVRVGANGQKVVIARKPWYKVLSKKKKPVQSAKSR